MQPFTISALFCSMLGVLTVLGFALERMNLRRRRELSRSSVPVTVDRVESQIVCPCYDPVGFVVVVSKVTTKELGPEWQFTIVDAVQPGTRFGIVAPSGRLDDPHLEVVYPLDESEVSERPVSIFDGRLEAAA